MEKPLHSTGPWSLDPVAEHPWKVVAPYENGPPGMATLFEVGYRPNAILAAAAPDMGEALLGMVEYFGEPNNAETRTAKAALRKAGLL